MDDSMGSRHFPRLIGPPSSSSCTLKYLQGSFSTQTRRRARIQHVPQSFPSCDRSPRHPCPTARSTGQQLPRSPRPPSPRPSPQSPPSATGEPSLVQRDCLRELPLGERQLGLNEEAGVVHAHRALAHGGRGLAYACRRSRRPGGRRGG
jgi:hypothetical protein